MDRRAVFVNKMLNKKISPCFSSPLRFPRRGWNRQRPARPDDGIGLETEFLGRTFTSVQRSHPRAEYVSVGAFITNPASFEGPAGSRMAPEGALRLDPARLSEGGRAGVQARAAG
jgi:hypothetical protein